MDVLVQRDDCLHVVEVNSADTAAPDFLWHLNSLPEDCKRCSNVRKHGCFCRRDVHEILNLELLQ